jgi:hypothetical protein
MARTKRVKKEKTIELASVTVSNHSSYYLQFSNEKLHFELEHGSGAVERITFSITPGATHVAKLRIVEGTSVKSIHYDLRDDAAIVAFETTEASVRASRIEIKDGDEVVLIDNPLNPALTTEQIHLIRDEIRKLRESCIQDQNELWVSLCKMLRRPEPAQLIRAYQKKESHIPRPRWQEIYKPLEPVGSQHALERLLKEPFILHAYWRALDRDPGGNTSFFTIRYAFQLFPNESQNRVEVQMFHNWDGENYVCGPIIPSSVQRLEGLHAKLLELILNQDRTNGAFNIIDLRSEDRSWYDTEWSSVELIAFSNEFDPEQADASLKEKGKTFLLASNRRLPKRARLHADSFSRVMSFVGPARPIFRMHQECLLGPQFRGRSEYHERDPVDGTPEQLEMVKFVTLGWNGTRLPVGL